MAYLDEHPPKRSQFRSRGTEKVSGAIVIHTAENRPVTKGKDTGALGVARYIQRRSTPGSYHSIGDSGSVIRLVKYRNQAYGEGTGGNKWSLHFSFATQAILWPQMPDEWVESALTLGAKECARMAEWVKKTRGITIPAERINRTQYVARRPGFIGHGDIDPGRRNDPGLMFPWERFLTLYDQEMETPMTPAQIQNVKRIQAAFNEQIRSTKIELPHLAKDGNRLAVDGRPGDKTATTAERLYENHAIAARELAACQTAEKAETISSRDRRFLDALREWVGFKR